MTVCYGGSERSLAGVTHPDPIENQQTPQR